MSRYKMLMNETFEDDEVLLAAVDKAFSYESRTGHGAEERAIELVATLSYKNQDARILELYKDSSGDY